MTSNEQNSEPAELRRPSIFTLSDTIVVKVGPEEKKYTLHKKLLAFHSGFFRGALSGNFKETDDGFIPLKDVRTKDFDVFVDWIYEKRLPEGIEGPDVYLLPIHEYVLADMLLASGLKKAAFDVMFDLFPIKDPVLQLFVDVFVVNRAVKRYSNEHLLKDESEISKLPQELLARMLLKMHAMERLGEPEAKLKREDYDI